MVFIGPFEHHSNELPWRESIADVVGDPAGHRRAHRPRPRSSRARRATPTRPLKIGSFSAASNVTGIVSDTARDLDAAARARRAVVLGLRRRRRRTSTSRCTAARSRTRWPTRTRSSCSPHKFIGGPSTPGRAGRSRRELLAQPGAGRPRRRHGRLRQPDRAPLPRRPGRSARRAARRRSSSRSAPGWSSSSSRRSAWRSIRAARGALPARGRSRPGRQSRRSRSSATSTRSGCRSCRSWSAPRAGATCTTTSSWRCSTTCSASSPAAAVRARARTATGCWASTWTAPTSSNARSPTAARASSRAGCGSTSTTSSPRRSFDYLVDAVRLVAARRMAAARRLPLRPGDRPVAPPPGSRRAATAPGQMCATTTAVRYPPSTTQAPESALQGYLAQAAEICREATPCEGDGSVSADFDHLRWFECPGEPVKAADRGPPARPLVHPSARGGHEGLGLPVEQGGGLAAGPVGRQHLVGQPGVAEQEEPPGVTRAERAANACIGSAGVPAWRAASANCRYAAARPSRSHTSSTRRRAWPW